MDANLTAALIGFGTALVTSAVPQIYQWYRDKKKQPQDEISDGLKASHDAAETVITYSGELRKVRLEYETLREDIVKLRTEREADKALIAEWQYGIERLCAQLVSLGHKPVWTPAGKAGGD